MQVLLDETRMREDRRALEKCLSLVAMRLAVHEGKMHLGWQGSVLAVMLVNMHNCNQQNSLWSVQTEKEFTKGHSQKPERSRELASGALKPDNNAQMTQGYPGHSSRQCQAEPGSPTADAASVSGSPMFTRPGFTLWILCHARFLESLLKPCAVKAFLIG